MGITYGSISIVITCFVCCLFVSLQTENSVQLCATHCVSHVIQLLVAVGDGDTTNQLASVFMDQVAPHAPPSLEQWPSEESLKYSLEW